MKDVESTGSMEGKEGFALLGRRDCGSLEVLALDAGEGRALCLFETQELADAFVKVNPEIRGQGWSVYVMTADRLPGLLADFDYAAVNPSPRLNSRQELVDAAGLARSLWSRSASGEGL